MLTDQMDFLDRLLDERSKYKAVKAAYGDEFDDTVACILMKTIELEIDKLICEIDISNGIAGIGL